MTTYPRQRTLLRQMLDAALAAVDPGRSLPRSLPPPPRGRTVLIAAGKAAAAMAQIVEQHWSGPLSGFAVTSAGYAVPCRRIDVVEAAHPLPDDVSVEAGRRALRLVDGLTADDLVLVLLSGGGSALLAQPAPGITLADKRAVTAALLASGASVRELNCVRKHLSAIKGGWLAVAAQPAQVVTLAVSDVPGDDPAAIASGPAVPDATSCDDALEILDAYGIETPLSVREALLRGLTETPKLGDARFRRCTTHVLASGLTGLQAAAEVARLSGLTPIVLGDAIEGDAREAARVLAGVAQSCLANSLPAGAPCVLLSGGATAVNVQGTGRGGRNGEFLLALAQVLAGNGHIHALACDTDGLDGTGDNAGALVLPDTLVRARAAGLDPRALLADNNSFEFFAALGDLVVTGPTRTDVNDFRAILVDRRG